MVHQSTEYFERCHAADLDPARSPIERRACWAAWLEHYARYQSSDRAGYARTRLAALDRGETLAQLSDPGATVTGEPPPRALPPGAPDARLEAGTRAEPSNPCMGVCGPQRAACVTRCEPDASECVTACAAEHRVCLRACL